ncbi:hypothetical protein [Acidovorax sp. Leaf160]|uniref:hypothetical protein n=1 Tax=Acidovorax sp. Leaf160 TaxID=1736280 RepID=UPI000B03BD3F|nr:hypothetical protein [Acidovorax sp. Leaf160]
MNTLTLGPGATLISRDFHPHDADEPVVRDVTESAVEYLFEPVTLHPDLKLGDVFKLFEACPELHAAFRRNWSMNLCEEARKGPVPRQKRGDPAENAGIEYMELYWSWALDTDTKTYHAVHRLNLHGVGRVLDVDDATYGYKAGTRIRWSVSLTPVRELLELPLRLCAELTLTEDDLDAKGYGVSIATVRCAEVLLGQVIQGIFDELAFHGSPQAQFEVMDELKAQLAEVKAGTAAMTSADDLFEESDRPGFDALFETLGGVRTTEVSRAMRDIEDDMPVGAALDRAFEGKVVVKMQFRDRPGREFRKLFRVAGR